MGIKRFNKHHGIRIFSIIRMKIKNSIFFNLNHSLEPLGKHGTPLQYSCLENPRTEEPGGLQFMGSLRVRHD